MKGLNKQTNHWLGRVKLYISEGKHGWKDLLTGKSSPLYFLKGYFWNFWLSKKSAIILRKQIIAGLDTNATVEIQFWLTGFQFPPATLCSKQNETGLTSGRLVTGNTTKTSRFSTI